MRKTLGICGYLKHRNQIDHYGLLWFRYTGTSHASNSKYFNRRFDNMCPTANL